MSYISIDMQLPNFDQLKKAAKSTFDEAKGKWDELSPGEKAGFVTTTAAVTVFNPLLPVVWLSVYGGASMSGHVSDEVNDAEDSSAGDEV